MRYSWFILLLLVLPVHAADRAMILNDQDQRDLVQMLDTATRAQGLSIAPTALRLYNKLQTSGVVTEQKPVESKETPDAK